MSDEAVRFFQALGDATRLELLQRLREGERTVGELVDLLRCPQPKVSRHLKVLKDVGLVTDRREGRHVTYALTTRRRWGAGVREWLDRLAGGFPPAPGPGDDAPRHPLDARLPASPRAKRPERPVREPARSAAGSPAAAAPPGDAGDDRPPPAAAPVRRPRLETHLL